MLSGIRPTFELAKRSKKIKLRIYDTPPALRARRIGGYLLYGAYVYDGGWITGHSNPMTVIDMAAAESNPYISHFEQTFKAYWRSAVRGGREIERLLGRYEAGNDDHRV
jgi:hypothetical protein